MVHWDNYMFLLTSDYWEVRKTKKKGWGVFCKETIHAGTVISDYLGTVIKNAEYNLENDRKGLYLMYFSDRASIYPDLTHPGPHLLNHSCTPNCWVYSYRGHTLFFALRTIAPGEELTISYLLCPNDGTCSPCTHQCECGSTNCTGTMHLSEERYNKWQHFQDKVKKKTKRVRVRYGALLTPLLSYPKRIPIRAIYAAICPTE